MGKTEKLGPLLQDELERTEGDPRVIVRLRPDVAVTSNSVSVLSQTGADVVQQNRELGFVVMDALPDQIDSLQDRDIVEQVELDAEVSIQQGENPFSASSGSPITALDATRASTKRSISEAKAQINANNSLQRGLDGSGTTVAVLDTGVRSTHPALEGQVTATLSLAQGNEEDVVGHGTWVASAVAGNGAEVNGRVLEGVAPGANIINGKVLNDQGTGRISTILTGINEAAKRGADVVCMSLGVPSSGASDSTICDIVDQVSQSQDVVVVSAAGNLGPSQSPHLPAACERGLAVGSVTRNGRPSDFSSRGPVGDRTYPDVAAPGGASDEGIVGAAPPQDTQSLRGTSMATPMVAGVAALLRQEEPAAPAQQIRGVIERTAASATNPNNNTGNGVVQTQSAVEQLSTSGPAPGGPAEAGAVLPAVLAGGLLLGATQLDELQ